MLAFPANSQINVYPEIVACKFTIHRTAVSQLLIFSTEGFAPNACAILVCPHSLKIGYNSGCMDSSLPFCALNLQRRFGLTLHVHPNCPPR